MAMRRMFSKEVVCTKAFLEMPPSSRALYFQLGVEADDDGFIDPYITMLATKSQDDDLKILLAKGFVISFESNICVIRHWRQNNFLRKDRYNITQYKQELRLLQTGENGEYTRKDMVNQWSTNGQPSIGKDRLGKDRLEERDTPTQKYGSFKTIDQELIARISEDYSVPITFVEDVKENMGLWLDQTGKRYKDYNAALRNWVKKDRAKYLIEAKRTSKGGLLDATNL